MARYSFHDYQDPEPTPWWVKVLGMGGLCALAYLLIWLMKVLG